MIKQLAVASAAIAVGVAAPAAAATFSLAGDFGASVFQYGTVDGSNNFSAFAASDCSDIGVSGLCFRGSDQFQVEFRASADSLLLHPGPAFGQNSILTFTAPTAGLYTFSATFTRADSGDGVNIFSFGTGGLTLVGAVNAITPTFTYAGSQQLAAGQVVGLGVERGGPASTYFNDSTLLSGAISGPVPEPATWAMMVLGFGTIGGMIRRRSVGGARTVSA
jgi:hypothetical protein